MKLNSNKMGNKWCKNGMLTSLKVCEPKPSILRKPSGSPKSEKMRMIMLRASGRWDQKSKT